VHIAAPPQPGYPYGAYPYGAYDIPSGAAPADPTVSWNQFALANAFNTMILQQPNATWFMDSGASSHLSSSSAILSSINPLLPSNSNIIVGNGTRLPITYFGHTWFPSCNRPLHLSNVLVSPHLIANLVSVRKFTKDNSCSIEFDPFGLFVKDLQTKRVLH